MITLTAANLLGIILVSGLLGGTFTHYGPAFLAWMDRRRAATTDDEIDDYRSALARRRPPRCPLCPPDARSKECA